MEYLHIKKLIQKILFLLAIGLSLYAYSQYQEDDYASGEKIFPSLKFDEAEARNALAKGTTTLKGKAFTKRKDPLGFKNPFADKIYANQITVELFPYTAYYAEWYDLKRKKEKVKKNKIVYMDSKAYENRLTCVTNKVGDFTFPEMKPGKYILVGTLPWNETGYNDRYNGSQFDGNSGRTINYYRREHYRITHSDFLMEIIEIKEGEKLVKADLK